MIGQRIVNLGVRPVLRQQRGELLAIVLIVQLGPAMRTLHDTGEKNAHGGQIITRSVSEGAPIVTRSVSEGAPIATRSVIEGAPIATRSVSEGAPIVTRSVSEGAPIVTRSVSEGETDGRHRHRLALAYASGYDNGRILVTIGAR
jgi:hypothetical protein